MSFTRAFNSILVYLHLPIVFAILAKVEFQFKNFHYRNVESTCFLLLPSSGGDCAARTILLVQIFMCQQLSAFNVPPAELEKLWPWAGPLLNYQVWWLWAGPLSNYQVWYRLT